MAYLLDTNVISPMLRDPRGDMALRVAGLADRPSTSIIVVAELRFAIAKGGPNGSQPSLKVSFVASKSCHSTRRRTNATAGSAQILSVRAA